ncbi:FadR/GntR family transcriptional regulator [Shumkonia mesophila]|uniref:FadR/GntR family transcriptional regulator n=1 Tax=Shumkonia mesophila TaxID=2838854 RepID=UPI00293420A8|nr:FadR/GntR family transcriptional regulator [Shumkonia mesophila]
MTDPEAAARFSAVRRRKALPEEIAQVLEREIADGTMQRGERLPTEAELSVQFGVSRNVLREAIARLKRDGLIQTRQGLGAFVTENPPSLAYRIGTENLSAQDDLRYVFELRAEVETGAAALAAERRSEAQLARIRETVNEMAEAVSHGADGVAADAAFHRAIAESSNNPYYRDFMIFLAVSVTQSIAVARRHSARFDEWTPKVQREHEHIYEAIAGRDAEAARKAVRTHLTRAAHRLGLIDRTDEPS